MCAIGTLIQQLPDESLSTAVQEIMDGRNDTSISVLDKTKALLEETYGLTLFELAHIQSANDHVRSELPARVAAFLGPPMSYSDLWTNEDEDDFNA